MRMSLLQRKLSSTRTSMMLLSRLNSEFSLESRKKFLQRHLITQGRKRLSNSSRGLAATLSQSPSVHLTAHTSSSRSSAPATRRPDALFHLHLLSMYSRLSRRSSLDSLSYSMDHLQFHSSMLTQSTNLAESFLMLSASLKSSSAKLPRAQSARSTSIQTHRSEER